jgi:hypothetical protein
MLRSTMRVLTALVLGAAVQVAAVGLAEAGGRGYGHGYRHHGHHHGHVGAGVALFLGGLVVGHLLTRNYDDPYYEPRPVRVAPPPIELGNCRPTTGETVIDGRSALMSGTWCTDQYGRGYVLDDSVRFERYLD